MTVPGFLQRRLYRRGSLKETAEGRFTFTIHNPLADATLIGPPTFVINGIHYGPEDIDAGDLDLTTVTEETPLPFPRGTQLPLHFQGRLLRGGNRIHLTVLTKEFDVIDFLVEDKEADFCDVPGAKRPGDEEE